MAKAKKLEAPVEAPAEVQPVEMRDDARLHEKAPQSDVARIAESREALKQVLPEGMAFFEAPDGFIIVGDATKRNVLYKQGDGGRGMTINQRR